MREPIYFHDEDYRYSFLYGNFITLTKLRQKELDRIVAQRLSPLYISIHATDSEARKELFCHKGEDHLMEKLEFLTQNEIMFHAQVVLVPGINDDEILEKTIEDLYKFKEQVLSLAIVPVGLTKHRENLPLLKSIDKEFAKNIVNDSKEWNTKYKNIEGDPFVTIADEFFILSGNQIPKSEYYGPYYQIENGVGLTREMLDDFNYDKDEFPSEIKTQKNILFITGKMIKPLLEKEILQTLKKIKNLNCEFKDITNHFYGESVTISGLLTGQDIIAQTKDIAKNYDLIVLPPRCLNDFGVFLDDISPDEMAKQFQVPVFYSNNNFMEIIEHVNQ
jgi:putative radical SAM enzyme (TIGR03279 family)